ncbi:MAG: hypothetical protein A3I00_07765 [Betaproteobacteria bacterium RIFCSPLOWO2_02_FULL_64_12]|nr:MAG: hypothetical protein A3I00_07765 [Betaproteobacteria bacterium RIFCSPLOWO2_02_FULL_64_12]OGL14302.1 MAG: hypothetical protein A3F92_12670 [Candidatus Rokubacteria bacterium RIFCSPLOWO2_12_FULL_71_22]
MLPEEGVGLRHIPREQVVEPGDLGLDPGLVDAERSGDTPSVEPLQAVQERPPPIFAVLDQGRGGLAYDAGEDGLLEVPQLLLDLTELRLEPVACVFLGAGEGFQVTVDDGDEVVDGLEAQDPRPDRVDQALLNRGDLHGELVRAHARAFLPVKPAAVAALATARVTADDDQRAAAGCALQNP